MNYKQILEDVIELNDRLVIIRGQGDIIGNKFNGLSIDNFWILLGKAAPEVVLECLSEFEFDVDRSGEYSFDIVMKYYPGDYDEYGRCICSGYYDVEYDEMVFIQTFEQRNRETKLNEILTNEFDNLFNI